MNQTSDDFDFGPVSQCGSARAVRRQERSDHAAHAGRAQSHSLSAKQSP